MAKGSPGKGKIAGGPDSPVKEYTKVKGNIHISVTHTGEGDSVVNKWHFVKDKSVPGNKYTFTNREKKLYPDLARHIGKQEGTMYGAEIKFNISGMKGVPNEYGRKLGMKLRSRVSQSNEPRIQVLKTEKGAHEYINKIIPAGKDGKDSKALTKIGKKHGYRNTADTYEFFRAYHESTKFSNSTKDHNWAIKQTKKFYRGKKAGRY